mgnify:CR=1 FL=1
MTQNTDQERELFEAFASDNGKWLKAIERDAKGNYLLLTTVVGWMWWRAARSAPAAPEPQGWKLVPVELLERIQESLGSFVSDQGWSQSDIDTADALDGLLARDLIEDTDPNDEAFDDFAEDVEDNECHNCSGTGEGMYDSQSCVVCLGKGFL